MKWSFVHTFLLMVICFFSSASFLTERSTNLSNEASITDWLSVAIYFLTLVAAVFAAVIAKKALDENKRMANDNQRLVDAQTSPFVDVQLEIMPESINWIRLKISNLGLSSAFNITFKIKDQHPSNEATTKVIEQFMLIEFMKSGLNYLSRGDVRYTTFVNLLEGDKERGFTVEEFLATLFTIEISYKDQKQKEFKFDFILAMNELNGSYQIGKTIEEQLVSQIKHLNSNLKSLQNTQIAFKDEYEKAHRDWTEEELKSKLRLIERTREINKKIGVTDTEFTPVIPVKKQSIQQIRKSMK